jgi:hypothetical protein
MHFRVGPQPSGTKRESTTSSISACSIKGLPKTRKLSRIHYLFFLVLSPVSILLNTSEKFIAHGLTEVKVIRGKTYFNAAAWTCDSLDNFEIKSENFRSMWYQNKIKELGQLSEGVYRC